MVELCLMASHGYPPGSGLVFHQEQSTGRVFKEYPTILPNFGSNQDLVKSPSFSLRLQQRDDPLLSLKPVTGGAFSRIESTSNKPVLFDIQDGHPDSLSFSYGIAEQCMKHEKILRFLVSGTSEVESGGTDLSKLVDLMGREVRASDLSPWSFAFCRKWCSLDAESQLSLIYPCSEFYLQESFSDLAEEFSHGSEMRYPYDRVLPPCGNGVRIDMKDILSFLAEFYLSNNSMKWGKRAMVIPYFNRRPRKGAKFNSDMSSQKLETSKIESLKSPKKINCKASPKRKSNKTVCKEDFYKNNYLHACECLLSIIVDKKRHGKDAAVSLRKVGPELPQLLTQFSASIAGTGLAVLFSVVCKVACGRSPFSGSKILSTALGFGLVWLSRAVNSLRDTVMSISKSSSKLGAREEEMMSKLDKSVKDIYLRAAALTAVAILRLV